MSSRVGRGLLLVALTVVLGASWACGHKEAPKPPPQKIPQPIRDLKVTQRGGELLLSFTYPQTTVSGLPIDDIVSVEIWELKLPVPEFSSSALGEDEDVDEEAQDAEGESEGEEPEGESSGDEPAAVDEPEPAAAEAEPTTDEPTTDESETASEETDPSDDETDEPEEAAGPSVSKETLLEVDPLQFTGGSVIRVALAGQELSSAISGDRIKLRLPLDDIEPGETEALVYGVKTFQTLDRASAFSNLAKIIPRLTPDPPTDLQLEPLPNGVMVSWAFTGDEPKEFRFYRRDSIAPAFDAHLGTQEGDSDRFLDATAELGRDYTYVMTAVINRSPLVESIFSSEAEIAYRDAFPPQAPTDLVALAEAGIARLLWEGSDDDDLVGYVLHRRAQGGEYAPLNTEPLMQTEYPDRTAESGRVYFYRVVAVDRDGNVSDPSEEVEVRIP